MLYRIRMPRRVQKQLDDLPQAIFDRVDERIASLTDEPRPSGVRKLQGSFSTYRVRVGDYRIVYEVDDAAREVRLLTVANRKDVYQ